jgi:hypothetical protein
MNTWPHSVRSLSAARSFCSTEAAPERYRARGSRRLAALIWVVLTRELLLGHNKQSKKYIQHSPLSIYDRIRVNQSWKRNQMRESHETAYQIMWCVGLDLVPGVRLDFIEAQ